MTKFHPSAPPDTQSLITALQSGDHSPETIARVIARLRELETRNDMLMGGLAGLLIEAAKL